MSSRSELRRDARAELSGDVRPPRRASAAAVAADPDGITGTVPIELRALTIAYPGSDGSTLVVIEELDARIEPGQIHCIAGRSGSGKTSILRTAAGLARPTSGDVLWGGRSIRALGDDERAALRAATVGYLDQEGIMLPGLTVLENVLLPAVPGRRTRASAARAWELLEAMGIGGRAKSRVETLSGGERQRAALARAMLLRPPVLVVDEPTASLDRANADGVIAILQDLARRGVAVLVSSHDPHLVGAADTRTELG